MVVAMVVAAKAKPKADKRENGVAVAISAVRISAVAIVTAIVIAVVVAIIIRVVIATRVVTAMVVAAIGIAVMFSMPLVVRLLQQTGCSFWCCRACPNQARGERASGTRRCC